MNIKLDTASTHDLHGILVALITPYDGDGNIDIAALDDHINRMISAGVHGLVPGGSTGEFTALSTSERKTLGRYMKDTSGNGPALTEMLFHRHDEITTFNGWDTLTFYGLAAGAKGSVWGATNIIPELSIQLWQAVAVQGDLKRGRELWSAIWPICKFLESHNYCSTVKTGMELRGWKTGGVRKPFALLQGEPRDKLRSLLQAAGVQTSDQ